LNFDIVFGREKHVANDSTSNELVQSLVNLCKELNFGVIFDTHHPYHKKISLDLKSPSHGIVHLTQNQKQKINQGFY
jgi:UV DNA damage repair endonuclease